MIRNQYILLFGYFLTILVIYANKCNATEYPLPPPIPKTFDNPDELQKYLHKLHNYYVVVGRPRFGKRNRDSINTLISSSPTSTLLKLLKNLKYNTALLESSELDDGDFRNTDERLMNDNVPRVEMF